MGSLQLDVLSAYGQLWPVAPACCHKSLLCIYAETQQIMMLQKENDELKMKLASPKK